MGIWTDEPIRSEREADNVRYLLRKYQQYVEHPSEAMPKEVTLGLIDSMKEDIGRYEKLLRDWEFR